MDWLDIHNTQNIFPYEKFLKLQNQNYGSQPLGHKQRHMYELLRGWGKRLNQDLNQYCNNV